MMYGLYNNYGNFGIGSMMSFIGGWIMMIVFWVLLIALIVWIVSKANGNNSCSHTNSNALEILKERYAKGEIDEKEFMEKKKNLS